MYKLTISTTANYPIYETWTRYFDTYEEAEEAMIDESRELNDLCNRGKIQDYQVEMGRA